MATHGTCVEVNNLGRRFGPNWVLTHVNLSIQKGESVALFGNNGSGKSTLLRILALLLPPTTGHVKIFGLEAAKEKKKLRGRIQFLSHEKRLYGSLSVLENLRLASSVRGVKGNGHFDEALERVDLRRFQDRRVRNLSEGMKKRLVLARLLLGDPELILLDEPYPTLDWASQGVLDDLILQWRKSGKTILLASHDHDQALAHADRLVVLQTSTIHYDGPPKSFGEFPK